MERPERAARIMTTLMPRPTAAAAQAGVRAQRVGAGERNEPLQALRRMPGDPVLQGDDRQYR